MLKVEELRAGYGRLIALDGVDLSVRKGEIVFVVGPNGAGKSTLLKTIVGLQSPFAGSITFQKKRINGIRRERPCQEGLVLVQKAGSISRSWPVEENLALGGMGGKDADVLQGELDRVLTTFQFCARATKA